MKNLHANANTIIFPALVMTVNYGKNILYLVLKYSDECNADRETMVTLL